MKKSNKDLVYLLDDDPVFSHALELWFEVQGYRIKTFHNVYSFFKGLKHCEPDIVILDFALNENYEGIKTGDQVAEVISQEFNNLPVIMLSAQKNIQIAVDMFSMHIVDYVVKDSAFHLKLKRILKNLKEMTSLRREIKELKTQSKVRLKRISFVACSVLIFWLFFAKMFM
ncbi:response regulator [Ancylomarina sp. DW003]|nr:response regulator [Ancylomarina sp. DW003]MDE5423000.1 response regulator [Ancylomarina sp. DW003]